jgi:hypothetical protein
MSQHHDPQVQVPSGVQSLFDAARASFKPKKLPAILVCVLPGYWEYSVFSDDGKCETKPAASFDSAIRTPLGLMKAAGLKSGDFQMVIQWVTT